MFTIKPSAGYSNNGTAKDGLHLMTFTVVFFFLLEKRPVSDAED